MADIDTQLQVIVNSRYEAKAFWADNPNIKAVVEKIARQEEKRQQSDRLQTHSKWAPDVIHAILELGGRGANPIEVRDKMLGDSTRLSAGKLLVLVQKTLNEGVTSGIFEKKGAAGAATYRLTAAAASAAVVAAVQRQQAELPMDVENDGVILLASPSRTIPPRLNYSEASKAIRLSISDKAGQLGMCSGIITTGFLAKDVINNDHFIIIAYSKIQKRRHYYWRFAGFATCNFTHEWDVSTGIEPRHTLYINVLCANVPGVAQKIMQMVICKIGKNLSYPPPSAAHPPLISAIQLSSLTYVIGYYYKKWGFRFYNKVNGTYDADVNAAAAIFPRIGPEIEGMADFKEIESWFGAGEMEIPEFKPGGAGYRALQKLRRLEAEVAKGQSPNEKNKIRRKTLPSRRRTVVELKRAMQVAEQKMMKVQEFMVLGNAAQYSVVLPNFRLQNRAVPTAEILQRLDVGGEGWRMYLRRDKEIPAAGEVGGFAPSIATMCAVGGGGHKKRRKRKRRKKGTKKRALKKRHRRRTKHPKRRHRTRRRGVAQGHLEDEREWRQLSPAERAARVAARAAAEEAHAREVWREERAREHAEWEREKAEELQRRAAVEQHKAEIESVRQIQNLLGSIRCREEREALSACVADSGGGHKKRRKSKRRKKGTKKRALKKRHRRRTKRPKRRRQRRTRR